MHAGVEHEGATAELLQLRFLWLPLHWQEVRNVNVDTACNANALALVLVFETAISDLLVNFKSASKHS